MDSVLYVSTKNIGFSEQDFNKILPIHEGVKVGEPLFPYTP